MTESEYQRTQDTIMVIARLVRDLPLDEFSRAIDTAHATAPILDPTLYRRGLYERDGDGLTGLEKMDWLQKLARRLAKFKGEIGTMLDRIDTQNPSPV